MCQLIQRTYVCGHATDRWAKTRYCYGSSRYRVGRKMGEREMNPSQALGYSNPRVIRVNDKRKCIDCTLSTPPIPGDNKDWLAMPLKYGILEFALRQETTLSFLNTEAFHPVLLDPTNLEWLEALASHVGQMTSDNNTAFSEEEVKELYTKLAECITLNKDNDVVYSSEKLESKYSDHVKSSLVVDIGARPYTGRKPRVFEEVLTPALRSEIVEQPHPFMGADCPICQIPFGEAKADTGTFIPKDTVKSQGTHYCTGQSKPCACTNEWPNAVSLDHADLPVYLNCEFGHLFCRGCIKEWLAKSPTCPICRFDMRGHFLVYMNEEACRIQGPNPTKRSYGMGEGERLALALPDWILALHGIKYDW